MSAVESEPSAFASPRRKLTWGPGSPAAEGAATTSRKKKARLAFLISELLVSGNTSSKDGRSGSVEQGDGHAAAHRAPRDGSARADES
jgi:hypothetical protein